MDYFELAGVKVARGERKDIEIPIAKLYTDIDVSIPIIVIRGKRDGPTLFVSSSLHGDELNGIEIIRRLTNAKLNGLKGTLIAVPMANPLGVLNQSRYLPDRRDLNRSFPGSKKGSLAARTANIIVSEILTKSNYGIDLHTGAIHRSNLSQIRADLDDPETKQLAEVFGVPVLINSQLRDGSLRSTAKEMGIKMLLYEAGEALRFDEMSIRAGYRGILNIMRAINMLPARKPKRTVVMPFIAHSSSWVRAPASGIVLHIKKLGDFIKKEDTIALINDPFGNLLAELKSPLEGIVIGRQNIPLVQEGEAMFHIAIFNKPENVAENVDLMVDTLLPENSNTLVY